MAKGKTEAAICETVRRGFPPLSYSCPRPVDTDGDGKVDRCLPATPGGRTDTYQTVAQVRELNAKIAAIRAHCSHINERGHAASHYPNAKPWAKRPLTTSVGLVTPSISR